MFWPSSAIARWSSAMNTTVKVVIPIPPERIGLLFVFRTFERISYGLVVQSEGTVDVNDFAALPRMNAGGRVAGILAATDADSGYWRRDAAQAY
jgi:hypothetical protein